MFKKVITFIICFSILPKPVHAISLSGEASIVICADTNQILYAENHNKRLAMASTTKIMTAIIALEKGNIADEVVISPNAARQEGSSIYLKAGEKVTLENLIYGLMLNSGNDAAMAISEHISKTEQDFVDLMNKKVKDLGLKNTNFTNSSGLPDPQHYSSAYDMAIIMSYAMKNNTFAKIAETKEHQIDTSGSITYLKNHNKLLWQYPYTIGGKTGYTKAAGRCFVSSARKNDVTIVAVTLNAPNDWQDHCSLLDLGFEKAKMTDILSKNDLLCSRKIHGTRLNILSGNDFRVPLKDGRKYRIVCKVNLDKDIPKNIKYGTHLGKGHIYLDDFYITSIDLVSGQNLPVKKSTIFFDILNSLFDSILLRK